MVVQTLNYLLHRAISNAWVQKSRLVWYFVKRMLYNVHDVSAYCHELCRQMVQHPPGKWDTLLHKVKIEWIDILLHAMDTL